MRKKAAENDVKEPVKIRLKEYSREGQEDL